MFSSPLSSPNGVRGTAPENVKFGQLNVTTEKTNKMFSLWQHAVCLVMCKCYHGLDGDPARGGAGSKISTTTTVEY